MICRKESEITIRRTFVIRIIIVIVISSVISVLVHEFSHIITGLSFGIKVNSFEITKGIFVIHFQESTSQIIELSIYISGSLGSIIFGLIFVLYGLKKRKLFFFFFGISPFYQEITYIWISCFMDLGDWANIFSILGFESKILFIFGIGFFIFYIILLLLAVEGLLNTTSDLKMFIVKVKR